MIRALNYLTVKECKTGPRDKNGPQFLLVGLATAWFFPNFFLSRPLVNKDLRKTIVTISQLSWYRELSLDVVREPAPPKALF